MRSEIEAVAACEPRRWGSVDAPPAPPSFVASWMALAPRDAQMGARKACCCGEHRLDERECCAVCCTCAYGCIA